MKVPAICFRGPGGAEVIALGETEVRAPGPGEVQVEIAAAGVNRADVLQRKGMYPAPPGAPAEVPGLELAGTVVELGPGAQAWKLGAEVMAVVGGGAMARRITLHERELIPVPAGISVVDAAAIPEAFLTAWDAMVLQAGLAAGETVLVHAAASGVGTAALQVARAVGARPLATTRTARKLAALTALGLAEGDGIVVADGRFAVEVQKRAPGGVPVILDCVGAAYAEENLRALAPRGRMVLLSTIGGASATIPLPMLLGKRLQITGSVLRSRPLEEKIALARLATARLVPLFERGALRPVIDVVMPMAACADAHARMEADATIGKIVLAW